MWLLLIVLLPGIQLLSNFIYRRFMAVPEVAITSVFPRTLPVIGGPITISGTGFNFTTPTTVTISKGSKSHPCAITNIEFDIIICKAAEGVSKGYTLTVNVANAVIVTAPVAYGGNTTYIATTTPAVLIASYRAIRYWYPYFIC